MRLHFSFQTRVAVMILALVVLIEAASFTAVYVTTRNNAIHDASERLTVGGRVFQRLLETRSAQLDGAVKVLTGDFGFKQAVATRDQATIRSALQNHGARVKANLAMLVTLDGKVAADTLTIPLKHSVFPFPELLTQAEQTGSASGIVLFRGTIYQLVIVPVYAPLPIGWVCMGFVMDQGLAGDLKSLTSLDVSFLSHPTGRDAPQVVSTLPETAQAVLGRSITVVRPPSADGVRPLKLAHMVYLTLTLPLSRTPTYTITAVLQNSLDNALQQYAFLKWQLLVIALSALSAALVLSYFIARSLGHPLKELAHAARRVEQGDYRHPVHVQTRDEMGSLAAAFNNMQMGIAERQEQIAFQAYHDVLTGLPNRGAIQTELQNAIVRCRQHGKSLAVLMLDLNRFKEINDTLGHHTGDQVLMELAQRFRRNLRVAEHLARLGGDEFLLVLENADAASATRTAAEIVSAMQTSVSIGEIEVFLDVSVGITLCPANGDDPETLIRRADIAMYDAKQEGVSWRLYQNGRDERHRQRLELIRDLRQAIEREELRVYYQPKVNLQNRAVESLEALVRWQHPRLGLVPPAEFIPLAEQSGNIRALTEWMLNRVVGQCREWALAGWQPVVSVNLSALDLLNGNLPVRLSNWLEASEVPPSQLTLEITESAVMRDAAHAMQVLNRLKACGVQISIDDFGTGYSSLAQLKRLPVDELKIDKSFLMQLREDSDDAVIVRSTIELAHTMGLKVVAEGVETDECLRFLHANRCDLAQGYFISRPMPAEKVLQWLSEYGASLKS